MLQTWNSLAPLYFTCAMAKRRIGWNAGLQEDVGSTCHYYYCCLCATFSYALSLGLYLLSFLPPPPKKKITVVPFFLKIPKADGIWKDGKAAFLCSRTRLISTPVFLLYGDAAVLAMLWPAAPSAVLRLCSAATHSHCRNALMVNGLCQHISIRHWRSISLSLGEYHMIACLRTEF